MDYWLPHAKTIPYRPGNTFPRLFKYDRNRDSFRRYVTDAPSPEKFANLLRSVDTGDLAAMQELQEEMEAKDGWLQGISDTRRGAITALDWDIVADDTASDETSAKLTAAYCRKRLVGIKSFGYTLKHMTTAIGPNLSVIEMIWMRGEIVEFNPIAGDRLVMCQWRDEERESEGLITEEYPTGIPFDQFPGKFIIYNPRYSPKPYRRTKTHATAWPYLFKHFSRTDWMAFSELYGSPIPVVTSDDSVADEDRTAAQTALENLGADAQISKPDGMIFELLQASGTGETYEKQMEHAQKEIAVLWLGQTLTSDIGDTGSFAAAKVHDNVRADILISDLEAEAEVVREQVLRPMVRFKFPGKDFPVPVFKRLLHERTDIEASRLKIDQLDRAVALGLPVDVDEAYEALNLTKPNGLDIKTVRIAAPVSEAPNGE